MTTPEQVRTGLQTVTTAAQADVAEVAAASGSPTATRAALFATVPLIVHDYADGAAALALDWYEELRDAAPVAKLYTPQPFVLVTDDVLAGIVARTTEALHEIERGILRDVETAMAESLALLDGEVQKQVASGFRDTMTGNSTADPDAEGWQRFARAGGCKFCLMLADRGAVYTEATVEFAAHTNCHCVVGPSFDPNATRADVMQYLASHQKRTPAQRAALRDYLNHNFPDAPG